MNPFCAGCFGAGHAPRYTLRAFLHFDLVHLRGDGRNLPKGGSLVFLETRYPFSVLRETPNKPTLGASDSPIYKMDPTIQSPPGSNHPTNWHSILSSHRKGSHERVLVNGAESASIIHLFFRNGSESYCPSSSVRGPEAPKVSAGVDGLI